MDLKYTAALESILTHTSIFSSNERFQYNNIKYSKTFCKWYANYTEKFQGLYGLKCYIRFEIKI